MMDRDQSVYIELADLIIQHIFNVTFELQNKPQHTFVNDSCFLGITDDNQHILFRWIKKDREQNSLLLASFLDTHGVEAIQNKELFSYFINSIQSGNVNAFVKKKAR